MDTPKKYDPLEVTNVQIYPLKESVGKIKAFANITLNDQIVIRNLRVIEGANGFSVSYPSDPLYYSDDTTNIVSPITRLLRDSIESAVLKAYQNALEGA